jgi:hypothetical protein
MHPLSLHLCVWFATCSSAAAIGGHTKSVPRVRTSTQILGTVKTTAQTTSLDHLLCSVHNIYKDVEGYTF